MAFKYFQEYTTKLQKVLCDQDWTVLEKLTEDLKEIKKNKNCVFLCGNGGSAANSLHIANDFVYGIGGTNEQGIRTHALAANQSLLTCLANDIGYDNIFSYQLKMLAKKQDLLMVLSGSGNSPNIINVLHEAKKIGIKSYAILGYSGGAARDIADEVIHFPIDDMQISEDCQLIVGHMLMRRLNNDYGIY